jgi:signal transduction histidine kinase
MKGGQRILPEKMTFPTLAAEELAAHVMENHPDQTGDFTLRRSMVSGGWQFTTPNRRVLALLSSDKLLAAVTKAAIPSDDSSNVAEIKPVPPDADVPDAFATLPIGGPMPGWRLAMSLKDRAFFDTTAGRQTAIYLWTGLLVIAAMGILTWFTFHLLRRQMTLARLKNDLAATVSHELKTPLSSMRVLVETLLDAEQLDEPRTREYLQLISQENERLGRVVENFLTFSRLERKKYTFHFSPLPARQAIDAAIESVRGRFEAGGAQLELQVEDNLPPVMADADALSAALINLLENAYKYSDETRHIVVRGRAENGSVTFSVEDNGIGITPRERKKIFQPFYQVDQYLSRKGSGCGLGLSIVQFVTTAHGGRVVVESQPGRGSTFSISLPVAPEARPIRKEAIA